MLAGRIMLHLDGQSAELQRKNFLDAGQSVGYNTSLGVLSRLHGQL
jgi:hypothetical protein